MLANTRFISMAECNTPLLMHWSYCRLAQSHWYINSLRLSRETHICGSDQTIIGSNNALSPGRRQAIIWTDTEIGSLGIHFSAFLGEIQIFHSSKCIWMCRRRNRSHFCLGLNVLNHNTPYPQFTVSCVLLWLSFIRVFRVLFTATGSSVRLCPSQRKPPKDEGQSNHIENGLHNRNKTKHSRQWSVYRGRVLVFRKSC